MKSDEELRRGIYEGVADGMVDIVGEKDGEHQFRLNDAGVAQVHEIVDAYIEAHGELAADALAQRLDVPLEVAQKVIAHSLANRQAEL